MTYRVIWFASSLVTQVLLCTRNSKTPRRILKVLLLITLILGFLWSTPSKALNGAPFHVYTDLDIALFSCSLIIRRYGACQEMALAKSEFLYECLCNDKVALSSTAWCFDTGYPSQVDDFIKICNQKSSNKLTYEGFEKALSYYHEFASNISREDPIHPPLIASQLIYTYRDSYDQFLGNYTRSVGYGIPIMLFWTSLFLLAAASNWTKALFPRIVTWFTGPISNGWRKSVTLPALTNNSKTEAVNSFGIFHYLQPTRAETSILVVFVVLVSYLSVCEIHSVPNDPIFDTSTIALIRYYSVRTGILATYLTPLLILFAGRNNILLGFTGWDYSTFMTFHRWISRLMALLVAVHSMGYGIILHQHKTIPMAYIFYGAAGTYACIALIVQALLILRRKFYEMFLFIHIVLAAIFLGTAWMHVKDLNFLWFYHFAVWVWISDRALRIHRLVSFGFPQAKICLFTDSTLKVSVPVPSNFSAIGGGHCFVHFLLPWSFWQSHPFTYTVLDQKIVFYVKVKDGITCDLQKLIEKSNSDTIFVKVAVEGSYGEATPALKYDSRVFIAGGNGIPGIYAEAVNSVKHSTLLSKTKLIWVVRNICSLDWFLEELSQLKGIPIEVVVYVSNTSQQATSKTSLASRNSYYEKVLSHVTFKLGRPDMSKIVSVSIEESRGSVCFVTCGHPAMVDSLRREVVQLIGAHSKRIDYFEQLQVWA